MTTSTSYPPLHGLTCQSVDGLQDHVDVFCGYIVVGMLVRTVALLTDGQVSLCMTAPGVSV